jgi:proteic killer suppression protein
MAIESRAELAIPDANLREQTRASAIDRLQICRPAAPTPPSARPRRRAPVTIPNAERRRIGVLDRGKQLVYTALVIRSFADAETERFFTTGRSRRIPSGSRSRAAMRLTQLDAALRVEDLRVPPSNQLEALKGDRRGQWSIRINSRWRICFRFSGGDAFDVGIVDYH